MVTAHGDAARLRVSEASCDAGRLSFFLLFFLFFLFPSAEFVIACCKRHSGGRFYEAEAWGVPSMTVLLLHVGNREQG